MPRKRSVALTDGELPLMRVLWEKGRATVGEVVDGIGGPRKPVYNTVLTMLRILEHKEYVTHGKSGRAFVYMPIIDRSQARRSAVRHLLDRFFDNSPSLLVLNLLQQGDVDPREIERLRELIGQSQQERR